MGKLDGKVALVTGSGRNIGRTTVLKLAAEGAHVVVNSRTNQAEADAVAREAQARGVKALAIVADVGKKDQVEALAAKMGLVGLARGITSEFAAHNIRVNVVSPGSIDTARANPEWYQGRTPTAAGIPLGRQGSVDEIAATCLFLVTDDGGFITGQTIHANGGVAYY